MQREGCQFDPDQLHKFMTKFERLEKEIKRILERTLSFHDYRPAWHYLLGYLEKYSSSKHTYKIPIKKCKIELVHNLRWGDLLGKTLSPLDIAEIITLVDEAEI